MRHQDTGINLGITDFQVEIKARELGENKSNRIILAKNIDSNLDTVISKLKDFGNLDETSKDFINHLLTDIKKQANADLESAQKNFFLPFRKGPEGSEHHDNALIRLNNLFFRKRGNTE